MFELWVQQVRISVPIVLSALCVAMGSAHAQEAAKPQIDYTPLEVAAEITIAADGRVESFVPESGPIPSLRNLLAKRSSEWRFRPPMWHGKPVRLSTDVVAMVNLAKRPDGTVGAILRSVSLRVTKPTVPELPRSLRSKVTTMGYAIDIRADGAITARELLWPEPAKHLAKLDATTRRSVDTWRAAPLRVDGRPIACADIQWVQFANSTGPMNLPGVLPKLEAPDVCPAVSLHQRFVSTPL